MKRLWDWYMRDIHSWEQYAREQNDPLIAEMVALFKSNRLTALMMGSVMLVVTFILVVGMLTR